MSMKLFIEDVNEVIIEDVNEDEIGGGQLFLCGVDRDLLKEWECLHVRRSEKIDSFSDCLSILPAQVRNSKFFLIHAALQKPKILKANLNEVVNLFGWMMKLRVPTEPGVFIENYCKESRMSGTLSHPRLLEMEPSGTGYLSKYWQNGKAMAPYNQFVNKKVLLPVALDAAMIQKKTMMQKKNERKLVDFAVKIMRNATEWTYKKGN